MIHPRLPGLARAAVLWCAATAGAVALAQGTAPTITAPPHEGASTPTVWTQISHRSYEAESPGLGTSKGYRSWIGTVTVYHYTLGISDWKDEVSDSRLPQQMAEVIGAIREAERLGRYANVAIQPVETVTVAGHRFLYFDATLDVGGRKAWSATLLTVHGGELLKLRMTTELPQFASPRQLLLAFAQASLDRR